MFVLTVALSKYTFILTLKLIISRENVDSKHVKTICFSHDMYVCMYVYSLASISGKSHIEHIN